MNPACSIVLLVAWHLIHTGMALTNLSKKDRPNPWCRELFVEVGVCSLLDDKGDKEQELEIDDDQENKVQRRCCAQKLEDADGKTQDQNVVHDLIAGSFGPRVCKVLVCGYWREYSFVPAST